MNSNVHPIVVALVLLLTGVAIATWMWGSSAAANIGGPSELKTDPRGHAFVQIQDQLVEHDANGKYLRTHALDDLGVDLFLGSFDFFSNGDVLLRRGPDPRSFGDNIRAYQRKTNHNSVEPDTPDAGLYRCSLLTRDCRRFGEPGLDFKASHGIFIDRATDEVYFSDTTRHMLRKYSADGSALTEPVRDFKFPNQIVMHDAKLYIADTNHHEVRIVDPSTSLFGNELGRENVAPPSAMAEDRIWPSHFARVADTWWVNNMRAGMNQGGIFIFDDNWRLIRGLKMPDGADPIAILNVGDEVWVSDWYNDKIRRFSTSGKSLADLNSAGLKDILKKATSERRKFEMIGYSGIALILLLLGGLAVKGLAAGMSGRPDSKTRVGANLQARSQDVALTLEPDKKALTRMARALNLFVILVIGFMAIVAYIIVFENIPGFGFKMIAPGIGMFLMVGLIGWANRSNTGTFIRIDADSVTLRDSSGRESSCAMADVRYDKSAIATQDVVVYLGRPMAYIYNRKEIEEKLFPRLAGAQKITPWEMHAMLAQQWHPQGIATFLALAALAVYAAWTISK